MPENSRFWNLTNRFRLKTLFGHRANGDRLAESRGPLMGETSHQTPQNFMRSALKLSKYWTSKAGAVGWGYLSTIVGMSFLNTYIGLKFAALNTAVIDGFNKANALATSTGTGTPEWHSMFGHTMGAMGMWAGVTVALIANAVYSSYFSSKMAAHWRIHMTNDFLDRYQKNDTFHRLQHIYNNTDYTEQRVQEDISTFTATATSVPLGILNASLAVGAYSGMLWNMSSSIAIPYTNLHTPGWMLGVTLMLASAMTAWTYKITKPLVGLTRMNQILEAGLRDGIGTWRKNSEAIAFLEGASAERSSLNKKFNAVMDNTYALIKRNKAIGWVQTYYGQATDFVPFLLLGPAVMMGNLTYGQMIQARIAMQQVNNGLSWPLNSMDFFARLKATTDRLATLSEIMDQSNADYRKSHPDEDQETQPEKQTPDDPAASFKRFSPVEALRAFINDGHKPAINPHHNIVFRKSDGDDIVVDNLTLLRPRSTETMIENINLRIKPGDRLVITGMNGCGKSTLLRTIGGFWPFGSGTVTKPENKNILIAPQASFVPGMSLKEIMRYPNPNNIYEDQDYRKALTDVGLERLLNYLPDSSQQKAFEDKLFAAVPALAKSYRFMIEGMPEAKRAVFARRLVEDIRNRFGDFLSDGRISDLKDAIIGGMDAANGPEQVTARALNGYLHSLQMRTYAQTIVGALHKEVSVYIPPVPAEPDGIAIGKELSGGERQRLRIASFLLQKPDILIMDEPTSALDEEWSVEAYRMLLDKLNPKTAIVSIVHNSNLIGLHNKHAVIKDGRLTVSDIEPAAPATANQNEAGKPSSGKSNPSLSMG